MALRIEKQQVQLYVCFKTTCFFSFECAFPTFIGISIQYANLSAPRNLILKPLYIFGQENAQKIAEFLSSHPRVKKVYYAGLPDHPGRALHYTQVLGGTETPYFGAEESILTLNVNCRLRVLELCLAL